MKVAKLHLENFKKFQRKEIDFRDEAGLVKDITVLVGKNGSGKSTILQSIASILGTATGRLREPADLDWPGFELGLAGTAWPRPPEIQIEVAFSEDELKATKEYYQKTRLSDSVDAVNPGDSLSVLLQLDPTEMQVKAPSPAEYSQFRGREYAKRIFRYEPDSDQLFKRVGSTFWYTEQRTTNSLIPLNLPDEFADQPTSTDLNGLRRILNSFSDFHAKVDKQGWELRPGQRDLYADLVDAYQKVFPNRELYGSVPNFEIGNALAEPWFYFYDGMKTYELSEMSGAERAIFPMLFDFANWSIHNSVILIDEIELHLHPPMQGTLIKALSSLGENNQFIITTHSEDVTSIVPSNSIEYL